MENQKKKCSLKKHSEIDAIIYCQKCKTYFCNKCQNHHSEIFDSHKTIILNNSNEIFIDSCKENNHFDKLEFYCKEHNTLCCLACISRIKEEGYGQHADCEVCHIKHIKDEKKNKLKENVINLEELYNQIEKSINELKKIYEEINKTKEELKLKIQNIFTKIRSALNEKEDKLLSDIDKEYDNNYFKEDLIKESEKLPNKIKKSIDKGKRIEKEWDENNLISLINDCIIIENNIKEINKINDNVKKSNLNKGSKIEYNIEEEQINDLIKNIQNFGKISSSDNLYNDFIIEKKNPIHKLTNHTSYIFSLCVLNDGRLVSGSYDHSITIYNKNTFQPDLIIKEHNHGILCVIQLNSGELVSCSADKTIKLYNINGLQYEVLQTLNYHKDIVWKIAELKNKVLVSCSNDSSIIFYLKDNKEYKKDYQITTKGPCSSIIQTKDNEICYSENNNNAICFYDIQERKIIASISGISKDSGYREWFIMIKKNLLLIPGSNQLTLINTDEYNIIRKIEVPNASTITGVCLLNKNMLLTGDYAEIIRQWKIEGDNLILISKKEKTHDKDINVLLNMGNGLIASGSDDNTIKIW